MSLPVIAVICAAHQGNGGMFSVDHAALSYFRARPCRFDLLVAQAKKGAHPKIRQRLVGVLTDPQELDKYTHVVYWGDFLNNPVYGRGDFARRDLRYGITSEHRQAYERWKSIFIHPPVRKSTKLISIGGNFQHNFSASADVFADIFGWIGDNFHAVLPRDPVSFQNISRALPFDRQHIVRQGIDCAFLNGDVEDNIQKGNVFCYTFNRSGIQSVERLVAMIEQRTGMTGTNVPKWLRLRPLRSAQDFDQYRRIIASSRFSLSDTYHFLINSMVLGVPALGLGNRAAAQAGTLGDFKKKELFSMTGLEDNYFELDSKDIEGVFSRVVERAAQITRNEEAFTQRYGISRSLADKFRSDIDFTIFGRRDFD